VEIGRQDADMGTLLINKGNGSFTAGPLPGLKVEGEIRRILPIRVKEKVCYLLARNNGTLQFIEQVQPR
jgi:hypothetical protein